MELSFLSGELLCGTASYSFFSCSKLKSTDFFIFVETATELGSAGGATDESVTSRFLGKSVVVLCSLDGLISIGKVLWTPS